MKKILKITKLTFQTTKKKKKKKVIQWMDSLVGKYETSSRVESKEVDDAFRISPDSKVTKSISSKSISSLHNEVYFFFFQFFFLISFFKKKLQRKVDVTLEDVMSACEQETRTSIAVFIGTEFSLFPFFSFLFFSFLYFFLYYLFLRYNFNQ